MIHEVKSWVGLFEPIMRGEKTHDLRVLDRDYKVGDYLRLREYSPVAKAYTGREATVKITYITSGQHQHCAFSPFALHDAMGILSIKLCEPALVQNTAEFIDELKRLRESVPIDASQLIGEWSDLPPGGIYTKQWLPDSVPDCSNASCGADSLTARMGPSFEEHEAA